MYITKRNQEEDCLYMIPPLNQTKVVYKGAFEVFQNRISTLGSNLLKRSSPQGNINNMVFIPNTLEPLYFPSSSFVVVLVCAFTPSYSLPRIIAAIETFVEATRIRSLDHIVILAANADEIEEGAADRAILHDESVKFVKGIPNSLRGLEVIPNNFILV